MGRSQNWSDLRSPISKIRDIRFVGTDDLIIFQKFHNFPWNIVAVARLESYFVVGSLDLTWWVVTWPHMALGRNFHKSCGKDGGKVSEKPGGAARRRIFAILEKPEGGVQTPPPPQQGAGWSYLNLQKGSCKCKIVVSGTSTLARITLIIGHFAIICCSLARWRFDLWQENCFL